jgi:hypothetical protein
LLLALQLVSAPGAVWSKLENKYLHITLIIAEGKQAKHAKLLGSKVQKGTAQRIPLPEPLQLIGVVQGFQ